MILNRYGTDADSESSEFLQKSNIENRSGRNAWGGF